MPNSNQSEAKSHKVVPHGYVLGAGEGEHLIHFRDGGNIFIKVDPAQGSENLALGTQQLPKGSGIPVHRHLDMDEAFYVLEGSGTVTLNDVRHSCETGGTIFIPRNTWHGFSSPDQEPARRTTQGIDAGADQRHRSQIWNRIQVGALLMSVDKHALPVSILCGDPKFPSGQHAGAIPPGSLSVPAQEHFGFYALHVVPVSERVFAGCREN